MAKKVKYDLTDDEKSQYMYFNLVKSDDDIAGMVAYCIYKKSKIENIIDFKKNNGEKPTNKDLETFQTNQCNKTIIDSHKSAASKLFQSHMAIIYSDKLKDIGNMEKKLEIEKSKLNKIKRSCPAEKELKFWSSVWSSVLVTLILGLIYSILWIANLTPSISEFLKNIRVK